LALLLLDTYFVLVPVLDGGDEELDPQVQVVVVVGVALGFLLAEEASVQLALVLATVAGIMN